MKFYIIPNMTRENTFSVTVELLKKLEELNCTAFMSDSLKDVFNNDYGVVYVSGIPECDVFIAVGGDGTFINAAKTAII